MDSSFVFQEQAPWRSSSGDEEEASPRLEVGWGTFPVPCGDLEFLASLHAGDMGL